MQVTFRKPIDNQYNVQLDHRVHGNNEMVVYNVPSAWAYICPKWSKVERKSRIVSLENK
jgi:hypothetical protein